MVNRVGMLCLSYTPRHVIVICIWALTKRRLISSTAPYVSLPAMITSFSSTLGELAGVIMHVVRCERLTRRSISRSGRTSRWMVREAMVRLAPNMTWQTLYLRIPQTSLHTQVELTAEDMQC